MHISRRAAVSLLLLAAIAGAVVVCLFVLRPQADSEARPELSLPSVAGDADDCAIWIHPTDGAKSTIIGNDKAAGPKSGLYVYSLDGRVLQYVPVDAPNNLDVRYNVALGGREADVCVVTETGTDGLRAFAIDAGTGLLAEVTAPGGIRAGAGIELCYGLALYRRPADGALFAFVSPRKRGAIRQFLLHDDGSGRLAGSLVRTLGGDVIGDCVEGMVADDELGFLYASDEKRAVLKFHADPDKGDALVARFAQGDGIGDDREGIAIYKRGDGTGYLLLSDQENDSVKVYAREGGNRFLGTVATLGSSRTDGLDVTSTAAGTRFPHGFLVCHNSPGRNFIVYDWAHVAGTGLRLGGDYDPRRPAPPDPLAQSASSVRPQPHPPRRF